MDRTANYYSGPTFRYAGSGGTFGVYSGSRREKGGIIFGSLARTILPVFGAVGKKILRRGAHKALDVTQNVVKDTIAGKNVVNSLKTHARNGAKKLSRFAVDESANAARSMIGSGRRRKRKAKPRTKRKTSLRKRKTVKRLRSKSQRGKKGRKTKRKSHKALF